MAAVLVEAQQYSYLYGRTEANAMKGQQQVLDMGLAGTTGVLGAVLLSGELAGDESGSRLVILSGDKLACFSLV